MLFINSLRAHIIHLSAIGVLANKSLYDCSLNLLIMQIFLFSRIIINWYCFWRELFDILSSSNIKIWRVKGTMISRENSLQKDILTEKNRLRNQLLACLKFHQHEILSEVPLEVAVKGMYEAWNACHSDTDDFLLNGTPTEINPKMNRYQVFSGNS